ncbi:hypothetical protein F0235_10465 [Vibrio splendidus]|uniref:hypothetical protein n=1 Tax=Vibrio splendidus TaxID=29497 RepID=UPI00148D5573|nr:hypothetical protein [Vibrio splendidus]NOI90864.1 hypothetical protein [Vibrio splendidus]
MRVLNQHIKEVLWFILGVYCACVIFAYATSESKDFVSVLNSLGGFISGGGAIAAILTLIHLVYDKINSKINEEVSYGNYILLTLERQITFLKMQSETLSQFNSGSEKELPYTIPVISFDQSLSHQINLEKGIFLLSGSKPEVLAQVDAVQRNFANLSDRWQQRNELWYEYHHSISSVYGTGAVISRNDTISILGETKILALEQATEDVLSLLPNSIRDLPKVHKNLTQVMMTDYPRCRVLVLNSAS